MSLAVLIALGVMAVILIVVIVKNEWGVASKNRNSSRSLSEAQKKGRPRREDEDGYRYGRGTKLP